MRVVLIQKPVLDMPQIQPRMLESVSASSKVYSDTTLFESFLRLSLVVLEVSAC